MAKAKAVAEEKGAEKFMLLPVLVLILAQMGTSGDNGALSLAATALTQDLGATTADIQLANMVYSLMAGAFMIAGGMMGTIIGWKKNFRMGALLCAAGEVVLAVSPNMTVFIWGGRTLVGFGASFMIPSVLGLVPKIYHGLFLFLVGVSRISAWGLVEPFPACPFTIAGISPCLPMAVLGVIILIVMINVEKKVEEKNGFALLPQSFLKTPQVLAGLAASAITFFFMGVQSILMAPYLQLVAGWSPAIVGVLSIVVGVPTFAFSIGIPKFMPKANPRRVIQVGYLTLAAALIIMAFSVTLDAASMPGILIGCVVAGSGAGIVSAQANNVVALAVNERDASQSGGIQTTMRNVGQAIGIALLGAVLLFGITNSVKDAAANDSRISESTVAAISERNIDLVSDENFRASIEDIDMSDEERDALVEINAQSRFNSTRFAYYVGAAIIVLGLATTPAIKKFSKEEE